MMGRVLLSQTTETWMEKQISQFDDKEILELCLQKTEQRSIMCTRIKTYEQDEMSVDLLTKGVGKESADKDKVWIKDKKK